ncbi:MAG: methionyl-tRNA formyltransferase [bacterium]|nr:methionyl-tRNA formyltransferase [bacterium]
MKSKVHFAFFGTSHIAVYVLDALEVTGYLPSLVVTIPAKPKGRGLEVTPTAAEVWAKERNIPVSYTWDEFENKKWDVAIIVDYGKIVPKKIIELPRRGLLNVHPSLLPRLRGASPIRTALLQNENPTGVTVMLVDEKMDHGPIVAQKKINVPDWPVKNSELEHILLTEGGALLAQILPHWIEGDIEAREQNHDLATFTVKIEKEDGLLDLSDDPYKNLLKIRAYEGWPGTFAFFKKGSKDVRVKIIDAHIENNALVIDRVVPEGKREMAYGEFLRSLRGTSGQADERPQ